MVDQTEKTTAKTADKDISGPRSLMRILGLFEALAEANDGMSLADLGVHLGAPKSSLLTLLRPLVAEGYLLHSGGRYRLGARIFRLSASVLAARNLRLLIRPYVEKIALRVQETVYFSVLDARSKLASCVEVIDGSNPIRYTMPVGSTLPLYCSAVGNVLLAYQDEAWLEDYLRTAKFERITPATLTSADELRRLIEDIRVNKMAVSIGRMVLGSAAIAAPVFTAEGTLMGTMAIAGPADRLTAEMMSLQAILREVSDQASGQWKSDTVV
ncbi:transcriptional regulator (plasmid) [Azospirillum sp. B510]|uniref:IclR family transcriptional regulator n=1 Tax=Azospirillum sp. (strain B510) TaxID=137722 RepID=UPI0001C4CB0A|nr:IclR family transcriptional regulator [Azospirillum sp. B510]BAI74785.1 transcriptional regulator [Azospirillum sp. B510]